MGHRASSRAEFHDVAIRIVCPEVAFYLKIVDSGATVKLEVLDSRSPPSPLGCGRPEHATLTGAWGNLVEGQLLAATPSEVDPDLINAGKQTVTARIGASI